MRPLLVSARGHVLSNQNTPLVPCRSLQGNSLNDKAKQALRKAAKKRQSSGSHRKSLFERMGISRKKEPASGATADRPGIELIL